MVNLPDSRATDPVVWLLLGDKRGDNAQVMALGRSLGWRTDVKQLYYDEQWPTSYHKRGATRDGIDLARSAPLCAPWPDIVIGIGRRSASVSRWIKAQSGNRTLNIRLGRPRTSLRHFDLVISTLQYGLAKTATSILLTLPLTLIEPDEAQEASRQWQQQFSHLPHPWTVILLGGKNRRLRLDRAVMEDLAADMAAYHAKFGGSILVTTSPRTPRSIGPHLQKIMAQQWKQIPCFLFQWAPGIANPYLAMLAGADQVIVTNDTVSMAADAAAMAKPLSVYSLPPKTSLKKPKLLRPLIRRFSNWQASRQESGVPATLLDRCYRRLANAGIIRPPRNIPIVFTRLARIGAVKQFDRSPAGLPMAAMTMAGERNAIVNRIRKLLAARRGVTLENLPRPHGVGYAAETARVIPLDAVRSR